ncbi:MAG: SMI1/KNR4 family protein [Sideroxydans sp.]|nr:SMI1/KNR4 family protein [Sideroxydans sp.]
MITLSRLVEKIEKLPELIEGQAVNWVGPSSEAAIHTVEEALQVKIIGSFRDFLLLKGGGGLDTLYISGIPLDDPMSGVYSDTIYFREDWCPHRLPQHLIVIERDADDNEPICLDTSQVVEGENPVVLYYYNSTGFTEKLAPSFMKFYENYLEPYFDDAGI